MSESGAPKEFKRDLTNDSGIPETEAETGSGGQEALQGVKFEHLNAASLLDLARDPEAREHSESSAASDSLAIEDLQSRFPDLEILECIGRGGMGYVYKARQKHLDRFVALKILDPLLSAEPRFQERFAREARALARLTHPNIVTLHDFGSVDDFYYLVMEYMDGMNLRELIQTKKLTQAEALEIVPELCKALHYAHCEGLVHRDIKPENVLFDGRGHVKIADFGLAKLVVGTKTDPTLTGTAQFMGTPYYMAPEQWDSSRSIDHRVDLYALGVVIYEMLTGQLPLGRFEPPSRISKVSPAFDEVVLRALQPTPDNRYQSAREIETDLDNVGKGSVIPERIVPVLPPQVQDATDKVALVARTTVFPIFSAVAGAVKSFILSLPLPTLAAFVLSLIVCMNTWMVVTYAGHRGDLPYYVRSQVIGPIEEFDSRSVRPIGPDTVSSRSSKSKELDLIEGYFNAWSSSILVEKVRVENYWMVYATGAIAALALFRPYLGAKSDLLSILIAGLGIIHVFALYSEQDFAFEGLTSFREVQITASPLAVGLIFVCLGLGCIWRLIKRVIDSISPEERGFRSVCRSFYRVVLDDTQLF